MSYRRDSEQFINASAILAAKRIARIDIDLEKVQQHTEDPADKGSAEDMAWSDDGEFVSGASDTDDKMSGFKEEVKDGVTGPVENNKKGSKRRVLCERNCKRTAQCDLVQ